MAVTLKILKLIFKWLAAIIIVLLTILFVIQVVIIVHFDKIVENTLKETVRSSTNDLYAIDFDKLSLNIFTGSITAKNIYLTPDTTLYNRLKDMEIAPAMLYSIYVPEFKISLINIYSAYFDRQLEVRKIYLREPVVSLLNEPLNQKEKSKKENPLDLYPLISSVFKKAEAKEIEIEGGKFELKKIKNDAVFQYNLSDLSIHFHNVIIDSTAFLDSANFFYSEDIRVDLVNHTIKLPDSLYVLKIGKTSLLTKNSKIHIQNLSLIPLHKKYAFAHINGKQTDRLTINVKDIQCLKVDLRELLDKQEIISEEIVVNNVDIKAFRDKRVPFDKSRRPKMPQDVIKELEVKLKVLNLRIRNLNVAYEEVPESGGDPGKVTFKRIFARITDINNDSTAIKNGQTIWITAQGYLMGKGLIKAKFKVPLNSPNGAYYYSGTLGAMDFSEMNPMVEPVAFIEIKQGKIRKMEFDVAADNDRARGTLKFYYNDLKIELLDKESGSAGLKEKVGSFIANNFIVISDNPGKEGFRTGDIDFHRDKSRFIFNYWWKSILSGIKPSIGITEERQNSLEQFRDKLKQRKKKKQERKEQREQKDLAKKQKGT